MNKRTLVLSAILAVFAGLAAFGHGLGIGAFAVAAVASIAIPFVTFLVSILWNFAINPIVSKVDSKLAKRALHFVFAPPSR